MTGTIGKIVRGRFAAMIVGLGLLMSLAGTAPAAPPTDTPDWTLESINGEKISFHDALATGPVVISFWATW